MKLIIVIALFLIIFGLIKTIINLVKADINLTIVNKELKKGRSVKDLKEDGLWINLPL